MKTLTCKIARKLLLKSALVSLAVTHSLEAGAQMTPADIEEMVDYAECIRANGYAEFPDPDSEGRQLIRITNPVAGEQFRTARSACTDKLPSRMAAANAPMTPERLEGLVKFAECIREGGTANFPDPTPQGVFEINDPALGLGSPPMQQIMATCRESTGVEGIRMMMRGLQP